MSVINQPIKSKLPPSAVEFEAAVLSALMIDKNVIPEVIDLIKPEMFYKTAHQEIFAAACWLYERSHPVDLLTIMEQLNRRNLLDSVGGPVYLTELSGKVTSSANVEYHSRVILEMYLRRELIHFTDQIGSAAYRNDADIFELLDKVGSKVIGFHNMVAGGSTNHVGQIGSDLVKKIRASRESGGEMEGRVLTSLDELDDILGGLQPGDLAILAARPAMGKTTFAQQVARKAAIIQSIAVSLHSLEMTETQITGGMICSEAGVNKDRIRDYSKFTEEELKRFETVADSFYDYPIYVNDTGGINIHQVRASAKAANQQAKREGKKLGLVIIDYLQLMSGTNPKGRSFNREQEVSGISKGLKELAKELQVPVIALSQLSRAVETRGGDKRPQLSDLRESGSLEQDADMVMFMYRPEYYKIMEDEQGNSLKGVTEIIVGKNRHGEAKDVRCKLAHDTGVFEPISLDFELPESGEPEPPYDPSVKPDKTNENEDIPF